MKTSSLIVLFVSMVLTLFLAAMPVQTLADHEIEPLMQADATSEGCYSLDVIFIVDQSGSMGSGYAPNDPLENRTYAPQWTVDWLADNALDQCKEAVHRITVISFGEEAEVDISYGEIGPDSQDQSKHLRDLLKPMIISKDLGLTDPRDAFEEAVKLLGNVGVGSSEEPRKRVIIFITDGEPCTYEMGCDFGTPPGWEDVAEYVQDLRDYVLENLPFDNILLNQEQCLEAVREDVRYNFGETDIPEEEQEEINRLNNECLRQYPVDEGAYENSTYIWTLLLRKGGPYMKVVEENYTAMSTEHAGELIALKQNRQEIPKTFLDILTQLAGVEATRISCGNFAINPYLREARLTFFKISEETTVQLSYSDAFGKIHTVESGQHDGGFDIKEYYALGANERYSISAPYPGIWRFEADDCQGIYAYYEPIAFDIGQLQPLKIKSPDGGSFAPEASFGAEILVEKFADATSEDPGPAYYLQYEIRDNAGNIIPNAEKGFFGIQFQASIIGPDRKSQSYEMEWLADQELFQSNAPLVLPLQGEYEISISGDTVYRDEPYGPLGQSDTEEKVYSSSRHLFDYSAKLNVVCPGLSRVDRCPWAPLTADDGCQVCETKTFQIEVLEPERNAHLGSVHGTPLDDWPLPVKLITIQARIVDQSGNSLPQDLAAVLTNPDNALIGWIEAGGSKSREIKLNPVSGSPGYYSGVITGWEIEGAQTLVVSLTSSYSEFYAPSSPKVEVSFYRSDSFVNRASFYFSLLIAVGLLLLGKIFHCVITSNNPVLGTLTFQDGMTTLIQLNLSSPKKCGKNQRSIRGKELKSCPQLGFRKIEIRNQGRINGGRKGKKKDVVMDNFTFSGSMSDHPGVTIKFWPAPKGKFFTVDVSPNLPTQCHSGDVVSTIQVKFEPPI